MTTGIPFLYSEWSNSFAEKGICHVNNDIHFPKSQPNPSRRGDCADCNIRYCSNHWFHLDADRPGYRPSRFEGAGLALESLRLPISSLD